MAENWPRLFWLLKYAGGGVVSYATPRLAVGAGIPLDTWFIAMGGWFALSISREVALNTMAVLIGAALLGINHWGTRAGRQAIVNSTRAWIAYLKSWRVRVERVIDPHRLPVGSALAAGETIEKALQFRGPVQLTEDQRQFRVALKQFSLNSVPELMNGVGRVIAEQSSWEKQRSDRSPQSVALHFFKHFGMNDSLNQPKIMELARADLEAMDVKALQAEIASFLDGYRWRQNAVAHLDAIVKSDHFVDTDAMKRWLAADANSVSRFDDLIVWPETNEKLKYSRDNFATVGEHWKQPVPVNY